MLTLTCTQPELKSKPLSVLNLPVLSSGFQFQKDLMSTRPRIKKAKRTTSNSGFEGHALKSSWRLGRRQSRASAVQETLTGKHEVDSVCCVS